MTIVQLEVGRTKWVSRISAAWQGGVQSVLETGRLLIAAKADLLHGEWLPMIENDLPFSASTAQRLMAIANDSRISNAAHVRYLPPSWGTLYELTKLDDATFAEGIRSGQINPEMERSALKSGQLVQQSLSNEHYTPSKYVEAARLVLGEIDLDPASCREANKVVKAKRFFSEDGETKSWKGRIWLNPPYGRLAGSFVEKLASDIKANKVDAAIVLVNAHCTDTTWFAPLWDGTLCFTDHRINFYGDDERTGSTHGSVFSYFGDKPNVFASTFSKFGPILRRVT